MILCDTGPLLCIVDRTQPKHRAYADAIEQLEKPLITTWACLTEAMHLAKKRGGWRLQKQISAFFLQRAVIIGKIEESDYDRLFSLMEKYKDQPMDLADATLVVTAEKIGETRILTLDSDFWVYRIYDRAAFDVIQVER